MFAVDLFLVAELFCFIVIGFLVCVCVTLYTSQKLRRKLMPGIRAHFPPPS